MNTTTVYFRAIATLLSMSMALAGCASTPVSIDPTPASITSRVVAGDHVRVQTGDQTLEFWVSGVNDTELQGTEGPDNQGRSVSVSIVDIRSISIYPEGKDAGGNNTLTIVVVVIGIIAAIALLSNDSAGDRFQGFPNP